MDGKDESGKVEKWQGELTSPNRLSRAGWTKSSVKPGDTLTISGYPAKSVHRKSGFKKSCWPAARTSRRVAGTRIVSARFVSVSIIIFWRAPLLDSG